MLIELILGAFIALANGIISLFPTINIDIPSNVLQAGTAIFKGVGYFIPIAGLVPILLINIAIDGFKLIMAIVVRIKSFIPTMGS